MSRSKTPKVSVCIPTYNCAQFLGIAIRSVLEQTFSDFELVICDDHSTDDTQILAAAFKDDRIRYYRNDVNLGLVGNWNHCIELATAPYIYIFHADDVMLPDNLRNKVRMLDENPLVGMVHSNIKTIDSNGSCIGGHWIPSPENNLIEEGQACFRRLALQGNFICCPTVMGRSECYGKIGIFNSRLHHTADMEMWMRIALSYDVGCVAEPSIHYRVHSQQDAKTFEGTEREMIEFLLALQIVFAENSVRIQNASVMWRQAMEFLARWTLLKAKGNVKCGRLSSALRYAILAMRFKGSTYLPTS